MLRRDRPKDYNFRFFHRLYYRCKKEDLLDDGTLNPARIKYQNTSVNWSKYGKPWDVIFDHRGEGVAQFLVCGLPKEIPKNIANSQTAVSGKPPKNLTKLHSFYPEHDPEDLNFPHCEIWTFRGNDRLVSADLSNVVKKEFRQIMSDRAVLIWQPTI